MPQARTQEERDIERRCKAWAFKIAGKTPYVLFHHLPGRQIGVCHPDREGTAETHYKFKKFGMRSWHRNVIVFDLVKAKEAKEDLEALIIHECVHLKISGHDNDFAAEMKRWIGRYEWGISSYAKEGEE